MKKAKHQNPNPREASNTKTKLQAAADRGGEWPDPHGGAWELKDAPTGDGERHPFDLEERTAQFGEAVIRLSKKIRRDPGNNRLIDQVVGAGTSVGANYCEADERVSKKDFRFTISRCVKEAKETMFFLRMIATAEPDLADEARKLYREARELMLIFASIYRK